MMSKVEIKLPTDFEERLSRLAEKTDEIIPKVLEAGGEVVLSKVRGNLSSIALVFAFTTAQTAGGLYLASAAEVDIQAYRR